MQVTGLNSETRFRIDGDRVIFTDDVGQPKSFTGNNIEVTYEHHVDDEGYVPAIELIIALGDAAGRTPLGDLLDRHKIPTDLELLTRDDLNPILAEIRQDQLTFLKDDGFGNLVPYEQDEPNDDAKDRVLNQRIGEFPAAHQRLIQLANLSALTAALETDSWETASQTNVSALVLEFEDPGIAAKTVLGAFELEGVVTREDSVTITVDGSEIDDVNYFVDGRDVELSRPLSGALSVSYDVRSEQGEESFFFAIDAAQTTIELDDPVNGQRIDETVEILVNAEPLSESEYSIVGNTIRRVGREFQGQVTVRYEVDTDGDENEMIEETFSFAADPSRASIELINIARVEDTIEVTENGDPVSATEYSIVGNSITLTERHFEGRVSVRYDIPTLDVAEELDVDTSVENPTITLSQSPQLRSPIFVYVDGQAIAEDKFELIDNSLTYLGMIASEAATATVRVEYQRVETVLETLLVPEGLGQNLALSFAAHGNSVQIVHDSQPLDQVNVVVSGNTVYLKNPDGTLLSLENLEQINYESHDSSFTSVSYADRLRQFFLAPDDEVRSALRDHLRNPTRYVAAADLGVDDSGVDDLSDGVDDFAYLNYLRDSVPNAPEQVLQTRIQHYVELRARLLTNPDRLPVGERLTSDEIDAAKNDLVNIWLESLTSDEAIRNEALDRLFGGDNLSGTIQRIDGHLADQAIYHDHQDALAAGETPTDEQAALADQAAERLIDFWLLSDDPSTATDEDRDAALAEALAATETDIRQRVFESLEIATDEQLSDRVERRLRSRSELVRFQIYRDSLISFGTSQLSEPADRLTELALVKTLMDRAYAELLDARDRLVSRYSDFGRPVQLVEEDVDDTLVIDLWLLNGAITERETAINDFLIAVETASDGGDALLREKLIESLQAMSGLNDFLQDGQLVVPTGVVPEGRSDQLLWRRALLSLRVADRIDALDQLLANDTTQTASNRITELLEAWRGDAAALDDYLADLDAIGKAQLRRAADRITELWLIRDLVDNGALSQVMAAYASVSAKYTDLETPVELDPTGDPNETLLVDLWLGDNDQANRNTALEEMVRFVEDGDNTIELRFRERLFRSLRDSGLAGFVQYGSVVIPQDPRVEFDQALSEIDAAYQRLVGKYQGVDRPLETTDLVDPDETLLIDLWSFGNQQTDPLALLNELVDYDESSQIPILDALRVKLQTKLRNSSRPVETIGSALLSTDGFGVRRVDHLLWLDILRALDQTDLESAFSAALASTDETIDGEETPTPSVEEPNTVDGRVEQWLGDAKFAIEYQADLQAIRDADLETSARQLVDMWLGWDVTDDESVRASALAAALASDDIALKDELERSLGDDNQFFVESQNIESLIIKDYTDKLSPSVVAGDNELGSPAYKSVKRALRVQIEQDYREELFQQIREDLSKAPAGDSILFRPANGNSDIPGETDLKDIYVEFADLQFNLRSIQAIRLDASIGGDSIIIEDLSGTTLEEMEINLGGEFVSSGTSNRNDPIPEVITFSSEPDDQPDFVTFFGSEGNDHFLVTSSNQAPLGPIIPKQTWWKVQQVGGVEYTLRQPTLLDSQFKDSLTISTGTSVIVDRKETFPGQGNDTVDAHAVVEPMFIFTINGGTGEDRLIGTPYSDLLISGVGDDTVTGGPGEDTFDDNGGFDTLWEERDANFVLSDTNVEIALDRPRPTLDFPDRRQPFAEPESLVDEDTQVRIFEAVVLIGGDHSNTFTLNEWTGGGILDGANSGDIYDLTVAQSGSGENFLDLRDQGTSGIDQLIYKGSNAIVDPADPTRYIDGTGDDLIQLDTVYVAALDPDREFKDDRNAGFGTHGDGLLFVHFGLASDDFGEVDFDEALEENPDATGGMNGEEEDDGIFAVKERALGRGEFFQVVNYSSIEINTVFAGSGDDKIVSEDTAQLIDVFGGEGDDQFFVGSILDTDTVFVEGQEIAVVLEVTPGASFEMRFFGGAGDDYFEVNHNRAEISLFGDNGDDTFFIKALLTIDEDEEPVEIGNSTANVSGVAGADSEEGQQENDTRNVDIDSLVYVENANINIDGGAGFDSVAIVGTVLSDTFYVYTEEDRDNPGKTVQRIYGAGVKLRQLLNIEQIKLITGPGDDRVYVYGVDLGGIGDLIINTGTGSDLIEFGGPKRLINLTIPTNQRTEYAAVEGYVEGPVLPVALGLGIQKVDNPARVVPLYGRRAGAKRNIGGRRIV